MAIDVTCTDTAGRQYQYCQGYPSGTVGVPPYGLWSSTYGQINPPGWQYQGPTYNPPPPQQTIVVDTSHLTAQINSLNSQISQKNSQISTLQTEQNSLQAQATSLANELQTVTNQINAAQQENQTLKARKATLQQQLKDLLDQIAANSNTISTLEGEEQQLIDQRISLEGQLDVAMQTIQSLEVDIANLNQQISRKVQQIQETQYTITVLQAIGEQMAAEFDALQKQLSEDTAALAQRYQDALAYLDVLQKQYTDEYTSCPTMPSGSVIADKSTGVLYKVSVTEKGSRLHPFPSIEVYRSHKSPPYTVYENYRLQKCERGDPVEMLVEEPQPLVPQYLPPTYMHPPQRLLILSAGLWMKHMDLKALQLQSSSPRPRVSSNVTEDSLFTVNPTTGAMATQSGNDLKLSASSGQEETGWNIIPYTLRNLGTYAFQLQMYNKKLQVMPGLNVTTLVPASNYTLETVWFVLPV